MSHVFSHLWLIDFIQIHKNLMSTYNRKAEAKLSRAVVLNLWVMIPYGGLMTLPQGLLKPS